MVAFALAVREVTWPVLNELRLDLSNEGVMKVNPELDDPSKWLPFKQWRTHANPKAVIETLCTGYIVNPGTGSGFPGDTRRADSLDEAKRYAVRFGIPFDSWAEVEKPN